MIPFSNRPKYAGQFVLVITPTGQGNNALRKLIHENLAHEYIMLVSDSAGEAIDGNDFCYLLLISDTGNDFYITLKVSL